MRVKPIMNIFREKGDTTILAVKTTYRHNYDFITEKKERQIEQEKVEEKDIEKEKERGREGEKKKEIDNGQT